MVTENWPPTTRCSGPWRNETRSSVEV